MNRIVLLTVFFFTQFIYAKDFRGDSWGFSASFPTRDAYIDTQTSVRLFTPSVYSFPQKYESQESLRLRLVLDLDFRDYTSFGEFNSAIAPSLAVEMVTPPYMDVVSSFVRFGIGTLELDDELYDGTLINIPVSLGLNLFTGPKVEELKIDSSYFIGYSFDNLMYDEEKSLPDQPNTFIREEALKTGSVNFGLNIYF